MTVFSFSVSLKSGIVETRKSATRVYTHALIQGERVFSWHASKEAAEKACVRSRNIYAKYGHDSSEVFVSPVTIDAE